ncbi:MAG TPA: SusC/RagA family TonB-linked outer membrane protein, partial [Prevotella sp.]
KYIAEFNAGYNGSEQFAPKNRYGFFPSASAAWNISREKFFEKWTNVVDKLKLRVSYGLVGNDKIGSSRFLYLDNVVRNGGGYSSALSNHHSISESFFGNPDLKWETAKKLNIGFELGLWRYFNLTFDVFSERRNNILIVKNSTPQVIGVSQSTLAPFNLGSVKNHGYELEMTFNKPITKDLFVLAKANLSYNDNEVIYMDELKYDETYAYQYRRTGYSLGQQWGMIAEGFFQDQAEIDAYAQYEGRKPRPGDLKFKDVNNDNVINQKDLSPIGYSDVPKYTAGLALSVTYKNFDISALFQGAFQVSGIVGSPGPYEWYDYRAFHQKAWTPERAASGEEILFPALSLSQSSSEAYSSTFFNMDRSYIRLKNLEIGYTLPKNWSKVINAKTVRFYVNGYNLITWDKMKFDDWDPELMNNSTYPLLKVWNLGVNVTF